MLLITPHMENEMLGLVFFSGLFIVRGSEVNIVLVSGVLLQ